MSMQINKSAYEKLIKEDIEWLLSNTKDSLERRHIVEVLNYSPERLYASGSSEKPNDLTKLGEISRHILTVKDHLVDMRLDDGEIELLKRIGYPERYSEQAKSEIQTNLDEAAENISMTREQFDAANKHWYNDGKKDGAMWQREQGVSFNTEVGWIDGPTIMDWPDDILDGFKMGDKVIVQIRKKDE